MIVTDNLKEWYPFLTYSVLVGDKKEVSLFHQLPFHGETVAN